MTEVNTENAEFVGVASVERLITEISTMSSKMPPVPSKNQSAKGPGEKRPEKSHEGKPGGRGAPDPDRQGHRGNTKVNTTHQGNQQDR